MKTRTIAVLFALTLAPAPAGAAPTAPPAPIVKLVTAVIAGTNSDNASAFAGLFTDDAVVVDENAPFTWRGADAGVAWWHVVEAVTRNAKLTHLKAANVRTGEFKASATDAYMVQAMTVTGVLAGKPFSEPGTMTYTFHKAATGWLISTMVWTTKP